MTKTAAKATSGKTLNVQVPGETAPEQDTIDRAQEQPQVEGDKPETIVTDADVGLAGATNTAETATNLAPGATDAGAVDLEALREQIRAEERAKLQDELSQQIRVAQTVVDNRPASTSSRNFRNMRAADVDPKTLTAPVLTKDGWVCPDVPPKK